MVTVPPWTKVSDALPTEYGTYVVVRGLRYMGSINYEIATTTFNPRCSRWFDQGFVYTHWFGPIAKPEMDLKEFPILCEQQAVQSRTGRIELPACKVLSRAYYSV